MQKHTHTQGEGEATAATLTQPKQTPTTTVGSHTLRERGVAAGSRQRAAGSVRVQACTQRRTHTHTYAAALT